MSLGYAGLTLGCVHMPARRSPVTCLSRMERSNDGPLGWCSVLGCLTMRTDTPLAARLVSQGVFDFIE